MAERCPSDLALEKYLRDWGSSEHASHVEACEACRARVARIEREGRRFFQYVYPATLGRVEEAAREQHARDLRSLPFAFAAAAAVLLLLARLDATSDPVPPPAETLLEGSSLGLALFVGTTPGALAVDDGAAIPAESALRFEVTPAQACRLWGVSVDAAGEVSRRHPPTGEGGAALDGASGLERAFPGQRTRREGPVTEKGRWDIFIAGQNARRSDRARP